MGNLEKKKYKVKQENIQKLKLFLKRKDNGKFNKLGENLLRNSN